MEAPTIRAHATLARDRDGEVEVSVNGHRVLMPDSALPEHHDEADGMASFGLLAGALSSCTALAVRTFLRRSQVAPAEVQVEILVEPGPPAMMHRHLRLDTVLDTDLRGQLMAVADRTPITVLLKDNLPIVTHLTTGTSDRHS